MDAETTKEFKAHYEDLLKKMRVMKELNPGEIWFWFTEAQKTLLREDCALIIEPERKDQAS